MRRHVSLFSLIPFIIAAWLPSGVQSSPAGAQTTSEQARRGCPSFHEVHPSLTPQDAVKAGIPVGWKVYPFADRKDETLLLREIPILPGGDVADVQAATDARTDAPVIRFRFDRAGTDKFAVFTRDNVGHPFAVVIDGRIISAPTIREPILNGEGQISGIVTIAEAQQLAARLKSGACR